MKAVKPGQSALLLLDVVQALNDLGVDYAVIGAMAASVHGAVRASLDADLIVSTRAGGAKQLGQDLRSKALTTELRQGDVDDPIAALLRISDEHDNRVDILFGLHGFEAAAFSRTIEVSFQGDRLRFIGREDFIAMKLFAGGPQDVVDAQRAIEAGATTLDVALVSRLAQRYGSSVSDTLKRLLAGVSKS